jgi:rRNA maturation RNase YbeY
MLQQILQQLFPLAQRLDPRTQWSQVYIHLVDDEGIRAAHQQYFGRDSVTDVISQSYHPLPGEAGSTGEIVVNLQQALRARQTATWSAGKELALYIAHGIDHLHGATDDTASEYHRMRRRELRWIQKLALAPDSYRGLIACIRDMARPGTSPCP